MKTIPKDELLALIGKTEDEQIKYFSDRSILDKTAREYKFVGIRQIDTCFGPESLADLAKRLWEKAKDKAGKDKVREALKYVCRKNEFFRTYETYGVVDAALWILFDAEQETIIRAISAIIALQRAGVEI